MFVFLFLFLAEDQTGKLKTTEDFIEKIDNMDAQINSCLDNLLEKG